MSKEQRIFKAYHQITRGCDCLYCKNFVVAVERLPQPVLDFFYGLGIDPTKEGEVSQYCENDDGTHLYGGVYHVVGQLISGTECWIKTDEETSQLDMNNLIEISGFTFGFTYGLSLLPDGFPEPAIQLEFQGNIPWVIDEKP
jgi:hypothetical protein